MNYQFSIRSTLLILGCFSLLFYVVFNTGVPGFFSNTSVEDHVNVWVSDDVTKTEREYNVYWYGDLNPSLIVILSDGAIPEQTGKWPSVRVNGEFVRRIFDRDCLVVVNTEKGILRGKIAKSVARELFDSICSESTVNSDSDSVAVRALRNFFDVCQ